MLKSRRLVFIICCQLAVGSVSAAAEPARPLIVAHRGLLLHAPENTLSNFRACLELRVGFEFDVQRTKDGKLVCIHDPTVNRTTNGVGKVADLTLAEIQKLDAGSWFGPEFAGEKAPAVAEVLALVSEFRRREALIAVDLKAPGVEQQVVRLAERHDALDRLLFIGRAISEPSVRRAIRAASNKAHVAAVANQPEEFSAALSDRDADWVYLRYLPSQEEISAVRQAGKRAFIAGPTVGGRVPENWRRAAAAGVDAILTDDPLELRATLKAPAKVE